MCTLKYRCNDCFIVLIILTKIYLKFNFEKAYRIKQNYVFDYLKIHKKTKIEVWTQVLYLLYSKYVECGNLPSIAYIGQQNGFKITLPPKQMCFGRT